jgi:AcrR family transcriptional regulator
MAPRKRARPHGRAEVVAAVVDAATQLFAQHGPAAVSLREVAEAADVNLGLIHRHIGSKADLLAAVLRGQPGIVRAPVRTAEEGATLLVAAGFDPPAYTVILLRAALDGYDLDELGIDFPLLDLSKTLLRARLNPLDADLRTALAASMLLGWHAVGRTFLELLGRDKVPPQDVVTSLEPAITALLTASERQQRPRGPSGSRRRRPTSS